MILTTSFHDHESEAMNKKGYLPKFQLILILRLQVYAWCIGIAP